MSDVHTTNPVVICHKWTFVHNTHSRSRIYFGTINHVDLPGIKLEILSGRMSSTEFFVTVSMIPWAPASVKVVISADSAKLKTVQINDWPNHPYSFLNLPISSCSDYDEIRASPKIRITMSWNFIVKKSAPRAVELYHLTKRLLTHPDFSDIMIVVDNEKIPVHKIILAIQSPVFTAMFHSNMKEAANNEILIEDIDIEIIKKVVEFLYTGEIDVNLDVETLLLILAAADKYQILALKNVCQNILCDKITIDTALAILEQGSLYGVPQLIEKTIAFMVKNQTTIVLLENFKELHQRKPELFYDFIIRIVWNYPVVTDVQVQ